MPPMKRVTHRDVARRAGVSTAVVSYVINNGPRATAPDTRDRVLAAIAELSYQPNASARGLRGQRTHTIGFIAHDYNALDAFVSPYTANILTGVAGELKDRDYYVLVYPMIIGEDLTGLHALLHGARVDGVIVRLIEDSPATDALLDVIAAARIPCVCIERPSPARFGFSSVTYDDEGGAYAATSYLIARGQRRIGYLQGDPRYVAARSRLSGYKRALIEQGVEVDDTLIQGQTWSSSDAAAATERLLHLSNPPTALFAASDGLAFSAIEVLRERGIRVPDDVAVIGFDDTLVARDMRPTLTTVRIPLTAIGRLAADLVLRHIDAGADHNGIGHDGHDGHDGIGMALPVELVCRGTA
jgi:DNA-binding LacI/PurR family transcriptional regulator